MKDILIVSLSTLTVLFAIFYFYLNKRLRNVSKDLKKLYIDNAVMQEYIDIIKSEENTNISDEHVDKENFIKFLSDSRDWAFGYIEDVQSGIKEFIDTVDPDLNYFDEYGEVGSAYPHYDAMVRINNAYKKLKDLMPKEEEIK
jgi:uncharacterized protein YoxC